MELLQNYAFATKLTMYLSLITLSVLEFHTPYLQTSSKGGLSMIIFNARTLCDVTCNGSIVIASYRSAVLLSGLIISEACDCYTIHSSGNFGEVFMANFLEGCHN